MDVFGTRWRNYTERLEKNWRAIVDENDTVVIPGDVSWAMRLAEAEEDFKFLDSLPGRKLLGKGNHDYWWETVTKMRRFTETVGVTSVDFLHGNAQIVENFIICGTRGWFVEERLQGTCDAEFEKLVRRETLRLEAALDSAEQLKRTPEGAGLPVIVFLHFPPVFGNSESEGIAEAMVRHKVDRCYYGHIHGRYDIPQTIDLRGVPCSIVAADYLDFVPHIIK